MNVQNYGSLIINNQDQFDTEGLNCNVIKMPATAYANNNTSIPVIDRKMTDLYKTLCVYNHLATNTSSGANYFAMSQGFKYPAVDGSNPLDGGSHSLGAFGYLCGSGTTQSSPADRWNVVNLGFDSRYSDSPSKLRYPLSQYWTSYTTSNLPALADGGGNSQIVSISLPANFYVTGYWLERVASNTWWTPIICPQKGIALSTSARTISFAAHLPPGCSCAADTYRIRIAGLLNPPFPLTIIESATLINLTNTTLPDNFRLYGIYAGLSQTLSGGYWGVQWGITNMTYTQIPGAYPVDVTNSRFGGCYINTIQTRADAAYNENSANNNHTSVVCYYVGVIA